MSVQHTDSFTVGANVLLQNYGDWVKRDSGSDDLQILAANDYVDSSASTGDSFFEVWEGSGFSTTRQSIAADMESANLGAAFPGLCGRVNGTGLDGYAGLIQNDEVELYEANSGSFTSIDGPDAVTANVNTNYPCKLTVDGTAITFDFDIGGQDAQLTASDATHSSGSTGLGGVNFGDDEDPKWDNVVIDDLLVPANPKGPLGMPLHGPFAGPVA